MESTLLPTPQNSVAMGVIGGTDGPTAIFTTGAGTPTTILSLVVTVAVIAVVGFVLWKKFGHR